MEEEGNVKGNDFIAPLVNRFMMSLLYDGRSWIMWMDADDDDIIIEAKELIKFYEP